MDSTLLNLFINFILGGFVVATTSWLGTFMNPLVAAIFWSYPITIIPSIFFMKKQGKDNIYIGKFLKSTTFALILLMAVTYMLSYFIKRTNQSQSLWIPIGKASLGYILCGILFYLIIYYTGASKYFL